VRGEKIMVGAGTVVLRKGNMRVLCEGLDGTSIEGEIVGGEDFDPVRGTVDLDCVFTVRCDDGVRFHINGWMVDTVQLEASGD
jgi:hypothetical protein